MMPDVYTTLRLLHILSSTILFGAGIGTALQMLLAHRSGHIPAIAMVTANVVRADTWLTLPAVIVQPLTGYALIELVGYDPAAPWLLIVYGLYAIAILCWLVVVVLQLKMRDAACCALREGIALPATYQKAFRWWFILGWPALAAFMAIFYLMVTKPTF
jgi:uncharacterized membrane protein